MSSNSSDTVKPQLTRIQLKSEDIHGGELRELLQLVDELSNNEINASPIAFVVRLKRIEAMIDKWRRTLTVPANAEYTAIKAMYPEAKTFEVNEASLTNYIPSGKWTWPATVKKAEIELEAAKLKAKADKTAIYVPGKIESHSFDFKIALG